MQSGVIHYVLVHTLHLYVEFFGHLVPSVVCREQCLGIALFGTLLIFS